MPIKDLFLYSEKARLAFSLRLKFSHFPRFSHVKSLVVLYERAARKVRSDIEKHRHEQRQKNGNELYPQFIDKNVFEKFCKLIHVRPPLLILFIRQGQFLPIIIPQRAFQHVVIRITLHVALFDDRNERRWIPP